MEASSWTAMWGTAGGSQKRACGFYVKAPRRRRLAGRRTPGPVNAHPPRLVAAYNRKTRGNRDVATKQFPDGGGRVHAARAHPLSAFLAACVAFACVGSVRAEDDLPGRVGRLAEAFGGVLVASEYAGNEWLEAGVNHPITTGDSLWSPVGGRAEVDYGAGQFRLASATHVQVMRLDDRELTLFVAEGALVVRVRFLDPGDAVNLDAPTSRIRVVRPGLYRIDVLPERALTVVTVRDGEAVVALDGDAIQALPGQTVTIAGQNPAAADLREGVAVDSFDAWSADRDRYYERGRSAAYVSREMVGAADLDEHGTWQTYPDYGPVWFPHTVPSDWAPYREGYWLAVGSWGPTWVDAAPWGYAPAHYGRWARIGGRWGWCPGGYVARPRWAPALVAWVGGPAWNVSASGGAPIYAWVPLGWRDPYLPPWRGCSQRCWGGLNHPYGVTVREQPRTVPARWENQRVPGALTAVPAGALAGGRPVARDHLVIPMESAADAPALAVIPALGARSGARPSPVTATAGTSAGTRSPPPASSYRSVRPGGYALAASERSPLPASPPLAPAAPKAGMGDSAPPARAGVPVPSRQATVSAPPIVPARRAATPAEVPGLSRPAADPTATPAPGRSATSPAAVRTMVAPAIAPTAPPPAIAPAPAMTAAPAKLAPAPAPRQDRGIALPAASPAAVPVQSGGVAPPHPPAIVMPPGAPAAQGGAAGPAAPGAAPGQAPGRPGAIREAPGGGASPSPPAASGPGAAPAPAMPGPR
jgi:hypothetical protein